jgi:hypothetical protein
MYLVSLSQPHNAASVLELSRSLEFEHEVRREAALQVMRWFGQVDDANERWEVGIEKVERQSVSAFCVNTRSVSASVVFFPALNPFFF